jgi:hypothetical protein
MQSKVQHNSARVWNFFRHLLRESLPVYQISDLFQFSRLVLNSRPEHDDHRSLVDSLAAGISLEINTLLLSGTRQRGCDFLQATSLRTV